MTLEIRPLSGPLGAIVTGWNPEDELEREDFETIQRALREHLALVFRGQPEVADLDLIGFAARFGDLLKGSEFLRDAGEHPEILPVTNMVDDQGIPKGTGQSNEMGWHSDYSYVDRVGRETFLNAVILPKDPPHTSFTDQYRALEPLPPKTVEALRPLRAFHSVKGYVDGDEIDAEIGETHHSKVERDKRLGIERSPIPEAEHPVVVRHPESGRELLYVSPQITRYIVGMPRNESDELLQELHRYSTRPEFVYHHDWETGDLVVFDNLGTMHRRDTWDPSEQRYMRQLSTAYQLVEDEKEARG
jgi:taurine dioxygenase/pentalenolactone F synthase